MEEAEAIRHASPDHASIFVVNWSLGDYSDDQDDPIAPEPDLIRFCSDMVHHYRHTLGKTPFVEFSGSNLIRSHRVIPVLTYLRSIGVYTGVYIQHEPTADFWIGVRDVLNRAVVAFRVDQHDPEHLIEGLSTSSDRVDIHVNIEFALTDITNALRISKEIAAKCRNITMGLNLIPGEVPTEQQRTDIDAGNILIQDLIVKSRTRMHQSYRGAMSVIYPDQQITMTPDRIIAENLNHWRDWTCNIGLEMIVIRTNGDISRGWCREGGRLGNVRDQIVRFPIEPITCGAETCVSPVDITCTKTWY